MAKAASSTKIAPTQHNDGANCDHLVKLLEPIAQPMPVFRPFFARSSLMVTKKFTWHPKTAALGLRFCQDYVLVALEASKLQQRNATKLRVNTVRVYP